MEDESSASEKHTFIYLSIKSEQEASKKGREWKAGIDSDEPHFIQCRLVKHATYACCNCVSYGNWREKQVYSILKIPVANSWKSLTLRKGQHGKVNANTNKAALGLRQGGVTKEASTQKGKGAIQLLAIQPAGN